MSERRSGRARKQVDYSKFTADVDNDDDFADSTPPPPKKQKTAEKTERKKDSSRVSKATSSDRVQVKARVQRVPLDEKLYERDLQAALELSIQESGNKAGDQSLIGSDEIILHSTPLPGADVALDKTELQSESQAVMPSAIPFSQRVPHSDDIEFLGTFNCNDSESSTSKQRFAARRNKPCALEKGSDSQDFSDCTESSDSDSEFDDSDSDFSDSRTKRNSKAKGKVKGVSSNKKPAAASAKKGLAASATKSNDPNCVAALTPVVESKPTASVTITHGVKTSTRKPAVSAISPQCVESSTDTTPSSVTSGTSGTANKLRVWTPPGHSGSSSSSSTSVSLKSPSSGLRLGLSRHARVKPLHSSLTVS